MKLLNWGGVHVLETVLIFEVVLFFGGEGCLLLEDFQVFLQGKLALSGG